jgi:putative ABC transport system permease protein
MKLLNWPTGLFGWKMGKSWEGEPMLKNNNKGVIAHITKSSLAASKGRNRLIGIVILLSAFLFALCTSFGINLALEMRDLTEGNTDNLSQTIPVLVGVALVIFLACTLAVYNIFYISIARRISEYGQLRTIGATAKQIKKIVRREGGILSVRFIPVGVVLGGLLSFIISPKWYWGESILCLVLSAGITFCTVWFSTAKPAKFAATVSPMEALRHTGVQLGKQATKKTARNLSAVSLGLANLARSKKKTVLTFLSLTLGGILFIGASSVMNALDPAELAKENFKYGGQYQFLSLAGHPVNGVDYRDYQIENPLTDELKEKILQIDGVIGVEAEQSVNAVLVEANNGKTRMDSIKPWIVDHLTEGSTDGGGIIVNKANEYVYLGTEFNLGDTVTLIFEDGNSDTERSFTVTGIAEYQEDSTMLHLPHAVLNEILDTNNVAMFEILTDETATIETENAVKALIEGEEMLSFQSRRSLTAVYVTYFGVATTAIMAFVVFIGAFALVNLINTVVTNTLQRKKEIGILSALGLSQKQFRQMLLSEYSITLLGSFIFSLLIGGTAGYGLVNFASNMDGLIFLEYEFPIWQVLAYFGLILAVLFAVTSFLERTNRKQSVVERIREL